ncbi:MAG TPA: type I restriction enzyme HsdR N-terminal domain-containing protein [Bacteroidales bacterium]|nr:type I restriction enzyme HsdR N-terminal domain-containing protein [Bacteroidales bacterium]HRZ49475.1 type I restriction enzyme HsdR N-terminal domain-containing protein [Bacteroidales bacterium]
MYPVLNFPPYEPEVVQLRNKPHLFDPVRKKWVVATPEEWVRQHVIRYLSENLGYPLSHMAIECSLKVNRLAKRADIVVYDHHLKPAILVECKAPSVKMDMKVLEQAARYNLAFRVPVVFVTNGITHYAASIDFETGNTKTISSLPLWKS